MVGLIIGLAVLFTIGIVYINWKSPEPEKKQASRESVLKSLADFLEAEVNPIENLENSYRINFEFDGINFVYEDLEDVGFQGKILRASLKTKTTKSLTFKFSENTKTRKIINRKIILASEINTDSAPKEFRLIVPKELAKFEVITDDIATANKLMANDFIVKNFLKYKNVDSRGYPSITLRISEGMLILDFHFASGMEPNLRHIYSNVKHIENVIADIIPVLKEINRTN